MYAASPEISTTAPIGAKIESSTEISLIEKFSIRLTPHNRVFVVFPDGSKRFPYLRSIGGRGFALFERNYNLPEAVQQKIVSVLRRKEEVIERQVEDEKCEPPADLLEDDESVASTDPLFDDEDENTVAEPVLLDPAYLN